MSSRLVERKDIVVILAIVLVSLAIGTLGYRHIAELEWIDSFRSASMILSSMGPVSEMITTRAKLFDSFYALSSGLVLIFIIGYFISKLI